MKSGPTWVIYEEHYNSDVMLLVSLLPPRRSDWEIIRTMRQLHVDRYGSIEERIEFKKHPNVLLPQVLRGAHPNPIHVGGDPSLVALLADDLKANGTELTVKYQLHMNRNEGPSQARFEPRSIILQISQP